MKIFDVSLSISADENKTDRSDRERRRAERLLFKTRNSAFWNEIKKGFRTEFTYISAEAARIGRKKYKARRHRLSVGR